jgi:2-polyprenyl-3-methyl-5-hydroxy-6-metoxy-1,4-benzoquinol methylase
MNRIPYIHNTKIHNTKAATVILPYVFDILKPKSVLDIGCGLGTWLKVASNLGVKDICGVDGEYLDLNQTLIDPKKLVLMDIQNSFDLSRRFDLIISLEVIEHLNPNCEDQFLDNLVKHGDHILFSGAIVNQGGQNHLNERSVNYWNEKFKKLGFQCYDIVRNNFWDNQDVEFWYKQNMFLYSKVNLDFAKPIEKISEYIHPELLELKSEIIRNLELKLQDQYRLLYILINLACWPKRWLSGIIRKLNWKFQ